MAAKHKKKSESSPHASQSVTQLLRLPSGPVDLSKLDTASTPGYPGEGKQDAPALTLAATAPHTVLDAIGEGVFQAGVEHGAAVADLPGAVDADTVAGEERCRRVVAAVALAHPDGRCVVVGDRKIRVHARLLVHREGGRGFG